MKYIRQRNNGNWQCRIYQSNIQFSFTSPDLEEILRKRNDVLGYNPDEEKREPKVLIFDIETSLMKVWTFRIFQVYLSPEQIYEDWYLLCFGYKWLGENKTHFLGLPDYPDYKSGNDNEQLLVEAMHNLLDEADIVVAHNGKKFDVKKVNSRFFYYRMSEPSPYKVVDTLKIARQNFSLTSNKLDYISKLLGSGGKVENEGLQLWKDCQNGDKKAWQKMKEYNVGDVDELESIYLELRGWDKSHPNVTHYYNDSLTRCTNCGSDDIEFLDEDMTTTTQTYPGYRCNNCGHFMRGRKNNTTKQKEILTSAR